MTDLLQPRIVHPSPPIAEQKLLREVPGVLRPHVRQPAGQTAPDRPPPQPPVPAPERGTPPSNPRTPPATE